jgi:outer membrane lipoprotein carrier protein
MTGDLDAVSTGFEINVVENSRTYDITLTPLKDRAMTMVKDIEMIFDRSDMSLSVLKMNEPSGDYVKYTFINKRFNTIVNENLFN